MAKKKRSVLSDVKRLSKPRMAKVPTDNELRVFWRKAVDEAKQALRKDLRERGNPRLHIVKTNLKTNELVCQAVSELMDEPGNQTMFMVDCDTD